MLRYRCAVCWPFYSDRSKTETDRQISETREKTKLAPGTTETLHIILENFEIYKVTQKQNRTAK